MSEPVRLFVFGTLRRGESNHHYLEDRYDQVLPAVLPDFCRSVALHGYPAVCRMAGEQVQGELFFLSPGTAEQTLAEIDILEDLPPGELMGKYYQRAVVTVQTAEGNWLAWAYLDPRD